MAIMDITARIEQARIKSDVFNKHIKPFISDREAILFNAFCSVDASDVSGMQKIKMQHTVLKALEAEFVSYINDGKIAKAEISNLE